MTVRYQKVCAQCERPFEAKRDHAVCCSQQCRTQHHIEEQVLAAQAVAERVNEHPLDEVRAQHEESKGRWTTIVRTHLNRTLLQTGYVSAEDFEALGVPDEHCNLANAQMGGYASAGYIEAVMFKRWSAEKKASRKSGKYWVYRLTEKGRVKLAGLGTEAGRANASSGRLSVEPGDSLPSPEGHDSPESTPPIAASGESGQLFDVDPPSQYDPWEDAA